MPRYEFSEGTSNKFWEIELTGSSFTTTYGKIGAAGQTTLKEFKSPADAKKEYDKLVAEKTKKGYQLVGGGKPAAAAPVPPTATPKARPKDDDEDDETDDDEDEPAAGGGRDGERYFEFVEGSSSKFWAIAMDGTTVKTRYGKIGTPGQATVKDFDGTAAANKEYDKLVAEKTKKGYVEKTAGAAGASKTAPAKAAAKAAAPAKAKAKRDDEDDEDDEDAPAAGGGGEPGERYFEFVEGSSSKFWAISIEGTTVKTRYGKIGTPGQATVKDVDSKAEAFKEHDKLVAEKTKKGYVEKTAGGAGGGGAGKTNPALEAAIFANPTDSEAYSVYADWMQGEGDPRGELIALQIAGKDKAAAKLIEKHADALLGPLAAYQEAKGGDDKSVAEYTWKYGFIHAARLSSYESELELAEVLEQLLRHPSGRFLTELTFGFNGDPSGDLQDLIDILARKAPKSLRVLHFGDFEYPDDTEMSWYNVGNLGKLWAGVPQLTTLIVQGGSFTLGKLALPNLVSATFRTGGLSKASAKAIASASWPKLEELEIWYGEENYGGDATVKDVQPLLARSDLPALQKLALKNAQFTDELCEVLPGARLVQQLTELDLSMGCMTDEGAQLLVAGKAALAHLTSLDVSENHLTPAGVAALKAAFKRINATNQRDDEDPEYRHPAVGE